MQASVKSLFDWLDRKSHGKFDAYAKRLERGSRASRESVVLEWPVPQIELEPMSGRELRPYVPNSIETPSLAWTASAALRVLLYSERVVLPFEILMPWIYMHEGGRADAEKRDYSNDLPSHLRLLSAIRPLVEDGSIVFAPNRRQDVWEPPYYYRLAALSNGVGPWGAVANPDYPGGIKSMDEFAYAVAMGPALLTVAEGQATPLALSARHERFYETAGGTHAHDRRHKKAATLASISVPDFRGGASDLVTLRSSAESLGDFRALLTTAFSNLSGLDGDRAWTRDDQLILADSLAVGLRGVEAELKKSPALLGLKGFARRLGFAATGATAGMGAGIALGAPLLGPVLGFAGGATVAGLEGVRESASARKDARVAGATWRIAMSFVPVDNPGVEAEATPID